MDTERNELKIRYSNAKDTAVISKLGVETFGSMFINEGGQVDIENGRYLCAVNIYDTVIAFTGLRHDREFSGSQITWTVTDPRSRGQGIMTNLWRRLLYTTDQPIYCSCWRIGDNDAPNLISLLREFNFKEVHKGIKSYDSAHYCPSKDCRCAYAKGYNGFCHCACDLYLRDVK